MFGVKILTGPKAPEELSVDLDGTTQEFDHWLFRLEPMAAQTLLSVQAANGQVYPLLTRHDLGKGHVYYVSVPLLSSHGKQAVPRSVIQAVFREIIDIEHHGCT